MEDITIRRATRADVDSLVDLHYRVFDVSSHQLLVMGRAFMAEAYQWYCESPNAFTLVADNGAGVVGCTTVNKGSYYAVFRQNWGHVAKTFVLNPKLCFHPLVLRRTTTLIKHAGRPSPANSADSAYLAYLAVDGSVRGKGVGAALIRETLATCKGNGWSELVTCFHRTNVPARFLYKTLGFQEYPELDRDDLVGIRISTSFQPKVKMRQLQPA